MNTNPSTTTLTIKKPDGNTSNYTGANLTNPANGDFYRDVTVDQAGRWVYRWLGVIGTSQAADEDEFLVLRSQ